jgi:hypothetical protein
MKYASILDRQPQLRTKVPESLWNEVQNYAMLTDQSEYKAVRELIALGLGRVQIEVEESPSNSPEGRVGPLPVR